MFPNHLASTTCLRSGGWGWVGREGGLGWVGRTGRRNPGGRDAGNLFTLLPVRETDAPKPVPASLPSASAGYLSGIRGRNCL